MTPQLRTLVFSTLGVSSLLVAGCTRTMDPQKVEDTIKQIGTEHHMVLKDISCPDKQPAKGGTSFKCSATDEFGTKGDVTVSVKNSDGDAYAETDLKVLDIKVIGDTMEAEAKKDTGKEVDVVCPAKGIFAKKGASFTCDVKVGTDSAKITFTFKDEEGHLAYAVK